jgi:UDP-N-acetylmuramoyl-L-alanyl-D-glutamate--2,6-diaminopimelate ligase
LPALDVAQMTEVLAGLSPRLLGTFPDQIQGVVEDSRRVEPGTLFVVRKGSHFDGRKFVPAARAAGATALLVDNFVDDSDLPQILVTDLPRALGRLAQRFAGDPSERLRVYGITGTNGKTTVSCLVEQALASLGTRTARLGTLGFFLEGKLVSETLTTPTAVDLAQQLSKVESSGIGHLVMEVSSHALAQSRVEGVRFAAVGLTNLTQDHLDFHGSMEEYGRAKARLFFDLDPDRAVVNHRDALGKTIEQRWQKSGRSASELLRYSAGPEPGIEIQAKKSEFSTEGVRADLIVLGQSWSLRSGLIGAHNLENLLLALGLLMSTGTPVADALGALSTVEAARGRLEQVNEPGDDVHVVVDYAHTPDAVQRVLVALRALSAPPLICVFGCGGDRDRTKRPEMGRAAEELSDEVIVTSDNPRTEDPLAIIRDIEAGMTRAHYRVEPERPKAIESAILNAPSGATVLLAGKGHETYQIIGTEKFPMDDRELARQALRQRRARGLKT